VTTRTQRRVCLRLSKPGLRQALRALRLAECDLLERSPRASARTQRLKGVPGSVSPSGRCFGSSLQAVRIACASDLTQRLNGVPGSASFSFDLLAPCCAQVTPRALLEAGEGSDCGLLGDVPDWGAVTGGTAKPGP
jgi:hypothetical protein